MILGETIRNSASDVYGRFQEYRFLADLRRLQDRMPYRDLNP